jgi:hypothetical protein
VVLFLISALFVVGLNLGALHSDDQTFQMPGWVKGLGQALVGSQSLQLTDLSPMSAQCLQQGQLSVAATSSCTYAIRQSLLAQRVARLQLVAGTSVTVVLTQEEMLPVQQALGGANTTTTADMKVYPGKTHGMLSIVCHAKAGESACLLTLK